MCILSGKTLSLVQGQVQTAQADMGRYFVDTLVPFSWSKTRKPYYG